MEIVENTFHRSVRRKWGDYLPQTLACAAQEDLETPLAFHFFINNYWLNFMEIGIQSAGDIFWVGVGIGFALLVYFDFLLVGLSIFGLDE